MHNFSAWNETPQFRKVYAQTMELVARVRDYITEQQQTARQSQWIDTGASIAITGELSRLTSHLSSVVSWLVMHKSLHSQKITITEVIERGNHLLCELQERRSFIMGCNKESSPELCDILAQASHLYEQITHIQNQLRRRSLN
ncbi:MAG: DUF1465 family protein [Alphaproteobacteria bacterium]|nr:DUF1465 family protein [Alphaproteobacteria bacterium]